MTTVDTSEKLDSQFIGFRGEIQSSRARLYPLSVNLGEVGGWMRTHIFVMFYLVLFYSVLFCFVLFCSVSFWFVLFRFNAQYERLHLSHPHSSFTF